MIWQKWQKRHKIGKFMPLMPFMPDKKINVLEKNDLTGLTKLTV